MFPATPDLLVWPGYWSAPYYSRSGCLTFGHVDHEGVIVPMRHPAAFRVRSWTSSRRAGPSLRLPTSSACRADEPQFEQPGPAQRSPTASSWCRAELALTRHRAMAVVWDRASPAETVGPVRETQLRPLGLLVAFLMNTSAWDCAQTHAFTRASPRTPYSGALWRTRMHAAA